MNIFVLSEIPSVCAAFHCDKHVNKMLIESVQMLSTAWHVAEPDAIKVIPLGFVIAKINAKIYKPYQAMHPCNLWVRRSKQNYIWLHTFAVYLAGQYRRRTGKIHATSKLLAGLSAPPPSLPDIAQTEFEQVMPEQYRQPRNVVGAYRQYYIHEKAVMAKWTNVEVPFWFDKA